jgi:prephenate dehydrogenase
MTQHIVTVGLGLIGASFTAALKKTEFSGTITAVVRNEAAGQEAVKLGLVDAYSTDIAAAVQTADVVMLAVPMLAMEQQLAAMASTLPDTAVVTDVGSVKRPFAEQALAALSHPERIVPAHPIAGGEKSGMGAANSTLFENRRVIVTPLEQSAETHIATVKALWERVGAVVEELAIDHHDRVLAHTSHVPHILAFALVDALAKQQEVEEIFRYAAGGFRDFSRIASSDPVMWSDICRTNPDAILKSLDQFSHHLQQIRSAIETGDGDTLERTFERAQTARNTYTDVQS